MQSLLVDKKILCHEQNHEIHRIKWQYIKALNHIQEDLHFLLVNKLKKKHIEWTKHEMNVGH